jgi:AcrR family transcriptional regulator
LSSSTRKLTRRERKALRTRQNILRTSGELFSNKGYDNVTMDEISEKVDLSRATLYNYYGSKEAIYFEIGRRSLSGFNDNQKKLVENGGTGLELILLLVRDSLKHLFEDSLLHEIIRQYSISNAQSQTPSHIVLKSIESGEVVEDPVQLALALFLKEMRIFEKNWTDIIELGYRDGSINNDVLNTEQLTHYLFLVILGIMDRADLDKVLLNQIDLPFEKVISVTVELIKSYLEEV